MSTLKVPVNQRDHIRGGFNATVTLVEYGDFECPWFARAHPIVKLMQARFADQLRFAFRNFPLTEVHPHAHRAAEAAESVAAADGPEAYWRMHHLLYEHQQDSADALDDAHLLVYAKAAGANAGRVRKDLEQGAWVQRVDADFMSGVRSGVNGTPAFFINGHRFDGDWTDPAHFATAIAQAAGS